MFIDLEGILRKPLVYLADFEMFLPTCEETVKYWKETCDRYGFIGIFPGEGEKVEPGEDFFRRVFEHDCNWMYKCDVCFAQLDDWRGHEPDSGTLFEIGYFIGKDLPSYGFYTGGKKLIERDIPKKEEDGVFYDDKGYLIEDKGSSFDNILNLIKIADSFEDMCRMARKDFDKLLIAAGHEPYPVKEG